MNMLISGDTPSISGRSVEFEPPNVPRSIKLAVNPARSILHDCKASTERVDVHVIGWSMQLPERDWPEYFMLRLSKHLLKQQSERQPNRGVRAACSSASGEHRHGHGRDAGTRAMTARATALSMCLKQVLS